jgi:hypothetical protein
MPITPENAVDIVMSAICCWKEARGESLPAKIAQMCVIRNRVVRKWGGAQSALDVVTQKWQFSAMSAPGDANLVKWPHSGDGSWANSLYAATYVLTEDPADITKGAVFYHDISIEGPPAAWGNVVKTAEFGRFRFYKDVK